MIDRESRESERYVNANFDGVPKKDGVWAEWRGRGDRGAISRLQRARALTCRPARACTGCMTTATTHHQLQMHKQISPDLPILSEAV